MLSPLSFTPEFRRRIAELPKAHRLEWLASLAARRSGYTEGDRRGTLADLEAELREVARACRADMVAAIEKQLGPFDSAHLRALLEVPRESFVRPEDMARSAEDTPLPLDDEGLATISAPHAYLLSYRLLELAGGDSLLELGTGSGYVSALASYIVGADEGQVVTVEIDEALSRWAARLLARYSNVRALHGDAMHAAEIGRGAQRVVVTFAVEKIPDAWLEMLGDGGKLVAPVGPSNQDQRLVRVVRKGRELTTTDHGAVRFVRNRSSEAT